MVSSLTDATWLGQIERLLQATTATREGTEEVPPSRFRCRLESQPHHLIPRHYLRDWTEVHSDAPLFLNPQVRFTRDGKAPRSEPQIASFCADFAPVGDVAWVADPGTGMWQPFGMSRTLAETLSAAQPGDPAPDGLSREMRHILALAGVLVSAHWMELRQAQWKAIVSASATRFREKGYVPVARLIHPFHLAELRRYYRYLLRTGRMPLGDDQCPRRRVAYNDEVARFFHRQLTAAVAALVDQPVKPSYVYVAAYQEGATLNRHVDREQCEFSITFCLDYSPEPRRATPWPLHLETPSAKLTVFQSIGDGLLYRGRELPHFREALPPAHSSTSIFFHYVRESFAGSLD